uniref:FAST kinase domain-containing protein 4 n=1 Tax=Latimeria chalumnae TaxID=7897 RepID=H3AIA0_LATCH
KISTVWNGNLVSLLRWLQVLGLEPHSKTMRLVENEAHWRLRRLSLKNLVTVADFYSTFGKTDAQKAVMSDVVKNLELRWTEIGDARTVATLMLKVGHRSKTLMDRLEDKGLELAEHFTPEDTRKVTLALAVQNRRSVPLLRALSYHLVQKHAELKSSVLIDLAFAYGRKLNFQQSQVFQKIASDLLPKISELGPSELMRCTKSFSYLKWLNYPLFEAFTQYVLDNSENFTVPQLSNMVLAFARLNYQPSKAEMFYVLVHEKLKQGMDILNPFLQVDVVWSLCILQQANPSYLQGVLDPQFHSKITGGEHSSKVQNYILKLIHINSTARLETAEYKGPYLPDSFLISQRLQGEKSASSLQIGLREALKSAIGDEAKYRCGIDTVYGWNLGGEVLLDVDSKPLPLTEFFAPHIPKSEGLSPIPEGAKRLAFLIWEFPNFTSRTKDLLGRFAMSKRHFQAAGFLIVDVSHCVPVCIIKCLPSKPCQSSCVLAVN